MFRKILLGLSLVLTPTLASAQVTGAGATFPYPIYSKWAEAYKKATGITVNYQSIGSGAGIKQITNKTVIFGATDMPLNQEELDKLGLVQFPLVIGSVVVVHNMKQSDLSITPQNLAEIYIGHVKKLNDQTVVPVRRSDGSGTTYLFTNWMSSVNDEFKKKIGTGASVDWPVGIGAKGNEGVASNVKLTKGAIGYVEYAYAKQNNMSMANLNIDGKTIKPNMDSFKNNLWPITSPTYILMYKYSIKSDEAGKAIEYFIWVMQNGDKMAEELDYIPISNDQKAANIQLLKSIK